MLEDVLIEPMTEEFVLWRCLHGGPLTRESIGQLPSDSEISWTRYRERNRPFLIKLIRMYGSCAILARDGDSVVGHLRFYPKAVCDMDGAGGPCLQQEYPAGPVQDFAERDFPTLSEIKDKTLIIHCMMTGSSLLKENPYQRRGIGSRMVKALIQWAQKSGWEHIEVESFEDIPIIYEVTGSAGHVFWEKLGFRLIDRHPHPALTDRNGSEEAAEFVRILEEQAESIGIPPDRAVDRLIMRLNLQ